MIMIRHCVCALAMATDSVQRNGQTTWARYYQGWVSQALCDIGSENRVSARAAQGRTDELESFNLLSRANRTFFHNRQIRFGRSYCPGP